MDGWQSRSVSLLLLVSALFVLVLAWVFSLPVRAMPASQILTTSYYADDSAQEDINSVQHLSFRPFNGLLALGNDYRPVWVKVVAAPSSGGDFVLLSQPNYTHHLEVWQVSEQKKWSYQKVGLAHPYAERSVKTLAPALPVHLSDQSPTTLFVKVVTPTTPMFFRIIKSEDNLEFNMLLNFVLGVTVGIGTLVCMTSFLLYQATRMSLWWKDSLFNMLGVCVLLVQTALISKTVFPDAGQGMGTFVLIMNALYVSYGAYFYSQLFKLFSVPFWTLLPFWTATACLPLNLALIISGHGDLAMQINNLLLLLLSAFAFVVIAKAKHPDSFMLRAFQWGYGAAVVMYLITFAVPIVLRQSGDHLMALYPGIPITLFTVFMLVLILARHTQLKLIETQRLSLEKAQTEQQLQSALRVHDETSSFLGMLMHEIKNPLSTIRMSMANLMLDIKSANSSLHERIEKVQKAAQAIDDVMERGVDIDRMVQAASKPDLHELNVSELLLTMTLKHESSSRIHLVQSAPMSARIDRTLFEMMVSNLLDNASKYSPPETEITVFLIASQTDFEISVHNSVGTAGFPDDQKVFGKYYRSPLAMNTGGLGLGLYWVRGVARQLGGDVRYQMRDNQAVFTLCLPR